MIGLKIDSGLLYTGTAVWQESGSKLYVFMQANYFRYQTSRGSITFPEPVQCTPRTVGGLIMFYPVVTTHMFKVSFPDARSTLPSQKVGAAFFFFVFCFVFMPSSPQALRHDSTALPGSQSRWRPDIVLSRKPPFPLWRLCIVFVCSISWPSLKCVCISV